MDLLDLMYQQKNYGEVLHSLGIPLDNVNLIPFKDGQTLIADLSGKTKGFITENAHGGVDVTDQSMNMIGSTNTIQDFTFIQDSNFQQTGLLQDNVHGGANLYQSPGQVEMISTENVFFGRDYYDSNMHLMGTSKETMNEITNFSMKESASFTSLNELDHSITSHQFSDHLSSFNDLSFESLGALNLDIWSVEATELFDFFDLF
ncbi:hypothetical protein QA612_01540 [Evansella sp. AB-P1]|uniref:hypothetical protein n=1 Tax=Evansella sp. AB-P1 TaxID=3037653 RepID=UPI00241EC9C3|nr:hypothetical protein [Evansella sp. AB-P1]MDG5786156.1 hypothetical protein [Evansella sp. AB-P1]